MLYYTHPCHLFYTVVIIVVISWFSLHGSSTTFIYFYHPPRQWMNNLHTRLSVTSNHGPWSRFWSNGWRRFHFAGTLFSWGAAWPYKGTI